MSNTKTCRKATWLLAFACCWALALHAQQPLNRGGMSYIVNPRPNNIVYHDSLFRGSQQFKHLFLRTGDAELLRLYNKHQTNKIIGQTVGLVGVVSILVGVNTLSADSQEGWLLIGGGFLASLGGSYLSFQAQRHLQSAVVLFNQRHNRATVSLGVGKQSAGLVYQF